MKKLYKIIYLLLPILLYSIDINAMNTAEWTYEGKTGPKYWGSLHSYYKMCELGKNQSPVNIVKSYKSSLEDLKFNYESKIERILNHGYSLQLKVFPGSMLRINDNELSLIEINFHSPSEHKINNKSFPLEVHFVHIDKMSNYTILAVLLDESENDNEAFKKILRQVPKSKSFKNFKKELNLYNLLPKSSSYYRINGSFTIPPCKEGVTWYVMKSPVNISKKQIRKYRKFIPVSANRPTQKLNARLILE